MIIGVDPGKNGAAAYISERGKLSNVLHFEKDLERCRRYVFYDKCFISKVFIETVTASPNMGVVSAFTFGRYAEAVETAGHLLAQGAVVKVKPQVWQEALGCFAKGNKRSLLNKAVQLFPTEYKAKLFNRKSADAVLIAYYGWKCVSLSA
jgi:hypothetical protein